MTVFRSCNVSSLITIDCFFHNFLHDKIVRLMLTSSTKWLQLGTLQRCYPLLPTPKSCAVTHSVGFWGSFTSFGFTASLTFIVVGLFWIGKNWFNWIAPGFFTPLSYLMKIFLLWYFVFIHVKHKFKLKLCRWFRLTLLGQIWKVRILWISRIC